MSGSGLFLGLLGSPYEGPQGTALSRPHVGKEPQITPYTGLEALIKVLSVGTGIFVFM